MALHLIPFVAGAVIGGLTAYFYRDEKVRKEVRRSASDLSHKVKATAGDVSHKVSEGFSDLRRKVARTPQAEAEETPKAVKKVARKKVSRKKTTAKTKARSATPASDTGA